MPVDQKIADEALATKHGEAAYRIVEVLTDAGFDAWWVGGCVRDMVQGNVPKEIDLATDAVPNAVKESLSMQIKGLSFDEKGTEFGTIVVELLGHAFEVTTFREDDSASDGRHPESVSYGKREDDAKRRDLTVNAMYWHPISRELYDLFLGEADLEEKLIRFVGDPATRIRHDALRIIRAVRFRAQLGGQYHPETYLALKELAQLTEILSGTRILGELEKTLMGFAPDRALEDMWELGITQYILPELHACKGIPQPGEFHKEGDVWDHMMEVVRSYLSEHGIDVRIAALFHDCGKVTTFSLEKRIRFEEHASVSAELATQALSRLQCTAKRREKIVWLIEHHMMMGSFASMTEKRKAHWYFHPWFAELLQVFYLDAKGTRPNDFRLLDSIIADFNAFVDSHPRPPKPLLSGNEVMDILGIAPGERVGEILQMLHEAQIKKEITTKKEAQEFLKKLKLG